MSELYLIAHSVRGEAAFDVAVQMECPLCEGRSWVANADTCESFACLECDSHGFWWIIPTSGHRAYPWWDARLVDIDDRYELSFNLTTLEGPGPMPSGWPDHYHTRAAPKLDITSLFKSAPRPHIARRL